MPFTFKRLVIIFITDVMSHGTGKISVSLLKKVSNWLSMFVHIVALLSREMEFM